MYDEYTTKLKTTLNGYNYNNHVDICLQRCSFVTFVSTRVIIMSIDWCCPITLQQSDHAIINRLHVYKSYQTNKSRYKTSIVLHVSILSYDL